MENISDRPLLRKVNKNDEELLFIWANDPVVRRWSFNKEPITLDEHKSWLTKMLNDENVLFWIFEVESTPQGLVRFHKNNNEVILNYLISPESRGKGIASKMLILAMPEIRKYWANIRILAYTLPENIASMKTLEKVGFYLYSASNGKKCYVFKRGKKWLAHIANYANR